MGWVNIGGGAARETPTEIYVGVGYQTEISSTGSLLTLQISSRANPTTPRVGSVGPIHPARRSRAGQPHGHSGIAPPLPCRVLSAAGPQIRASIRCEASPPPLPRRLQNPKARSRWASRPNHRQAPTPGHLTGSASGRSCPLPRGWAGRARANPARPAARSPTPSRFRWVSRPSHSQAPPPNGRGARWPLLSELARD